MSISKTINLLHANKESEEELFTEIRKLVEIHVYKTVYSKGGYASTHYLEDLIQEVVLYVWSHISNYDKNKGAKFSSFIYTLVIRRTYKLMRFNYFLYHQRNVELNYTNEESSVDNSYDYIECINDVKNSNLKDKQKEAVIMYLQGYSRSDIADKLSVSRPYIYSMLKKVNNYVQTFLHLS